ncbi:MAG: hypothetical protein KOO63_07370 [Bacteroidales bacterium]|nr:hypothetical protein [Candidatus Latescibacterota bacterium]
MSDRIEKAFPESIEISGKRKEMSRMESAMRGPILEALKPGPMTVPEVAEAIGAETHETMRWMMGCWRYGYITATGEVTDEGYYKYALAVRD